MGNCQEARKLSISEEISEKQLKKWRSLETIFVRDLIKQVKLQLKNQPNEIYQRYLTQLTEKKPITNYQLVTIPCLCPWPHLGFHYAFDEITDLEQSELNISRHLKVTGLTSECIMYFDPDQQRILKSLNDYLQKKTKKNKIIKLAIHSSVLQSFGKID